MEDLLVSGNEEVKNGIATGFVEAVLGDVSAGRLKADTFAGLLGKETVNTARLGTNLRAAQLKGSTDGLKTTCPNWRSVQGRAAGFDKLILTGERLTGANPGKIVEIIIDLTK